MGETALRHGPQPGHGAPCPHLPQPTNSRQRCGEQKDQGHASGSRCTLLWSKAKQQGGHTKP